MEETYQLNKRSMSGQQLGQENVETVRAYVEGLKLRGERMPMRAGRPNWTAIAAACSFGRGVFYDNAEARAVIEQSVNDEALIPELSDESVTPVGESRTAHLQQQLERSERQKQRSEEQSAVMAAENAALRQENKELRERLRRLSAFEEILAASGKRFIP